jgi:hypothetical protein
MRPLDHKAVAQRVDQILESEAPDADKLKALEKLKTKTRGRRYAGKKAGLERQSKKYNARLEVARGFDKLADAMERGPMQRKARLEAREILDKYDSNQRDVLEKTKSERPGVCDDVLGNCLSYALKEPGGRRTGLAGKAKTASEPAYRAALRQRVAKDAKPKKQTSAQKHFKRPPSQKPGTRLIAMTTKGGPKDPNRDYHFYRQGPTGGWSHKQGFGGTPTNRDASGQPMKDLERANLEPYSQPEYFRRTDKDEE